MIFCEKRRILLSDTERKDVIRGMTLHRIHSADIDEMIYGSGKTVVSER